MTEARRAYTYRTAAHDYSTSEAQLRRAVKEGRVRARHKGRQVLLHPDDLDREFGFGEVPLPRTGPDPLAVEILEALGD